MDKPSSDGDGYRKEVSENPENANSTTITTETEPEQKDPDPECKKLPNQVCPGSVDSDSGDKASEEIASKHLNDDANATVDQSNETRMEEMVDMVNENGTDSDRETPPIESQNVKVSNDQGKGDSASATIETVPMELDLLSEKENDHVVSASDENRQDHDSDSEDGHDHSAGSPRKSSRGVTPVVVVTTNAPSSSAQQGKENETSKDLTGSNVLSPGGTAQAGKQACNVSKSSLPDLPPAPLSSISIASSNASLSTRKRRLPPPPPAVDWADSSKSMLGKRQGSSIGPASKRPYEDFDLESISVRNEPPPKQNKAQLLEDRKGVSFVGVVNPKMLHKITFDTLVLGKKMGVMKHETYVDTTFCDRETLERLMEIKYDVRKIGAAEFVDMQSKMNDFAVPPTVFKFNDAFVYANLDALIDFGLTNPCDSAGTSIVFDDLLYAVDIHGGPGGFVEYMLTKKQWEAKVYGFTLKESSYNYKLESSGHYPVESFEQWYGWDGVRGDGNIYRPDFVDMFVRYVKRSTDFKGVHVVVAGGREITPGFDEDTKELRCKNIFLAETLIALQVLRKQGTFVLRLYDIFTPYTAGLLYLLFRVFRKVAIIRPEAAVPGSAERFLVCKHYIGWEKPIATDVVNYLSNLHGTNHGCYVNPKENTEVQAEIVELVPTSRIVDCRELFVYLCRSNSKIGNTQLDETKQMVRAIQFKHNGRIERNRKSTILKKCAEVWSCPYYLRQKPRYENLPLDAFQSVLLRPYPADVLSRAERDGELEMTYSRMDNEFLHPDQWHFVSVGRDRGFYLSRGGDKVYRFTGGEWKLVPENLVLADETLVYGDFVDEVQESSDVKGKQYTHTAFHIIDGLILGGRDVRSLAYTERMQMCAKFGRSMCHPSIPELCLIRAKTPRKALEIGEALRAVTREEIKGSGQSQKHFVVRIPETTSFHAYTGYLFLRTVKADGDGNFVPADFLTTMQNRLYWKLGDKTSRNPDHPSREPERPNAIVDPHTINIHVNLIIADMKRKEKVK